MLAIKSNLKIIAQPRAKFDILPPVDNGILPPLNHPGADPDICMGAGAHSCIKIR